MRTSRSSKQRPRKKRPSKKTSQKKSKKYVYRSASALEKKMWIKLKEKEKELKLGYVHLNEPAPKNYEDIDSELTKLKKILVTKYVQKITGTFPWMKKAAEEQSNDWSVAVLVEQLESLVSSFDRNPNL